MINKLTAASVSLLSLAIAESATAQAQEEQTESGPLQEIVITATHIATKLQRQPYEIAFPGPFIAILLLLAHLPKGLQLAIGKRLSRTESHS